MAKKKSGKTSNIVFISTAAIAIVLLVIYYYSPSKAIDWRLMYRPTEKAPYDTYIVHELLHQVREQQTFKSINDSLEIRLKDSSDVVDNYIYIGSDYYLDSLEVLAVADFVKAGNRAFIFSDDSYNTLLHHFVVSKEDLINITEDQYDDQFLISQQLYNYYDTTVVCHATAHPELVYDYSMYSDFKKTGATWNYFVDSLRTNEGNRAKVLGGFNTEYVNYIVMKVGKGEVYFHSNPVMFTNYYAKNDTLMPYIQEVFSYLGGGDIIWDEESRNYEYNLSQMQGPPSIPEEGPLEFILSEPALQKAWYLLIVGALLYLAFGSKRKQRIIATMENMENTSIEYAETIAQLFMKQEDHTKLVKLKIELFKAYVRERLKMLVPIHTDKWDEEFTALLSQRSGIQHELVSTLVAECKYYEAVSGVQTEKMLEFHNTLEEFYFNTK